MSMNDKVIVITGASMGIGAELAREVTRRGAKGVVLAARNAAEHGKLAEELGQNALAVPTDVSRRADLERRRDRTLERFGHLHVLVNNAGRGISRLGPALTDAYVDFMVTTTF